MAEATIPAPDADALAAVLDGYVVAYDDEAGTATVTAPDVDQTTLDAAVADLPPRPAPTPPVDRLAAIEARLDRAAAAQVAGDAAKVATALRATP